MHQHESGKHRGRAELLGLFQTDGVFCRAIMENYRFGRLAPDAFTAPRIRRSPGISNPHSDPFVMSK